MTEREISFSELLNIRNSDFDNQLLTDDQVLLVFNRREYVDMYLLSDRLLSSDLRLVLNRINGQTVFDMKQKDIDTITNLFVDGTFMHNGKNLEGYKVRPLAFKDRKISKIYEINYL